MKTTRSQGFTVIEGLLIVVVVAILGGVGFVAYNSFVLQKSGQSSNNTPAPAKTADQQLNAELQTRLDKAKAQPGPDLKAPEDLSKAVNTLKDQSAFDTSKEAKQMNDMASKFLK